LRILIVSAGTEFADGRDAASVPSTPEALEAAFRASSLYAELVKERAQYLAQIRDDVTPTKEFEAAVADERQKGVSKNSPYTVTFGDQVWALTVRQFNLRMQDRLGLSVSYITAIIVALITGSVYLNLPATAAGAFTRGGYVLSFQLIEWTSERRWLINWPQCPFHRPPVQLLPGLQ
jgi:ATP-binding cassette, subfamily G (WHITE), member 2, SNQ2